MSYDARKGIKTLGIILKGPSFFGKWIRYVFSHSFLLQTIIFLNVVVLSIHEPSYLFV
jgi:hypothetical protein